MGKEKPPYLTLLNCTQTRREGLESWVESESWTSNHLSTVGRELSGYRNRREGDSDQRRGFIAKDRGHRSPIKIHW